MSEELIPAALAAARKCTSSAAIWLSLAAFTFAANSVIFFLRFRKDDDPFHIILAALSAPIAAALLYRSITLFAFLAREAELKISEQVKHLNASLSEG